MTAVITNFTTMKESFAQGCLVETQCELRANAEVSHKMWESSFNFLISPGTVLIYEGEDGAFTNWRGPDIVFCSVPVETHKRFASEWFGDMPFLHEHQLYRVIRIDCKDPKSCFRMIKSSTKD